MGDLTTKDIKIKCMKSQNCQNLNMRKREKYGIYKKQIMLQIKKSGLMKKYFDLKNQALICKNKRRKDT